MKYSAVIIRILAGIWLISVCSCKKNVREGQPVTPAPDSGSTGQLFQAPSYFPEPVYDFSKNPLTKEKVELGRMLFYDPILSADSTIACSNCHQPFSAFSHLSHSVSHGINRKTGTRNAPGLFNLAWMPNFMLDGGIVHLDMQSLAPLANPAEMGNTLQGALTSLNNSSVYRKKFKQAWNVEEIGSEHMLKSLSQFMLTIVSANTKYDEYKQGRAALNATELKGLQIVRQKCSPCHGGELFTDFSLRNIGLDSSAGDVNDLGREIISRNSVDRRKFRSPSLRNFSLTSPYFHNGTAYGLNAVLDRHDTLVQDSPNLDPLMKLNGRPGIPLTQEERSAIYAFLQTLTDFSISRNPAFLTPFDKYAPVH